MNQYLRFLCAALLATSVVGCVTYYQKTILFHEHFVNGELEEANNILDKNKKASKDKNRLLYFFQKGVVLQMMGQYEESNQYLEQAYIFTEDYRKSYSAEAASILVNPNLKPYVGEDHELVLMHYFKVLNYASLSQYEEALVECRRINNKLNALNDRYENRKNRYKRDAFALNLMGIVYDVSGDVNNAFIAYKNAYEAYRDDYAKYFEVAIPQQLKQDLLRTAYLNGFNQELERYEQEFGRKYQHEKKEGGELLFFWHNGLGPVKDEWSINFAIVKQQGGAVLFVNEELGLSFPFNLSSGGTGSASLADLKFIRVAFPKYIERRPLFERAELWSGSRKYPIEKAENINAIGFSTLEDRMLRELSNSLLRLAWKQVAEEQMRKENENIGALLSVASMVSEKADTRNWQTLPYSISYARIPLKEGDNALKLKTYSQQQPPSEMELGFKAIKGQTIFHVHNDLSSFPIDVR